MSRLTCEKKNTKITFSHVVRVNDLGPTNEFRVEFTRAVYRL